LTLPTDPFQFLRSYVDYFYLVLKSNEPNLPLTTRLQSIPGWCVGDAHPENFGVLIQNDGVSMFTMNDMDDSGPCPIGVDLIRLMVSSRLYSHDIDIDKLLNSYLKGLERQAVEVPSAVLKMLKKSQKRGTAPSSKNIEGRRIVRDSNMVEVNATELDQIKLSLRDLKSSLSPQAKLLDAVATSKIGGGSGGILRYEILLDNGGDLARAPGPSGFIES